MCKLLFIDFIPYQGFWFQESSFKLTLSNIKITNEKERQGKLKLIEQPSLQNLTGEVTSGESWFGQTEWNQLITNKTRTDF